ncbi:uncharacterized protein MONOS_2642 [Monocercomonoides exilis]|uniref:uncharacterized protein n=1 Tax=Monocercomonoides exilis TaxID=2049356 RepID=UPI00355ABA61|nr:hypothetical protein MONOS_2642 [Monocercomonoides exilis]|eukprot:MONOS_2642.1-p1 / transcript=MONOS_2642.1 / gene=MONOS_2642 / organism=Monocercomonoides_exilis_PA203 / gene_product=unspecified product / transcript_product=unspecified product / location=Mono_scaffold00055:154488-154918(+) / protein_length=124 / sequence_SO=supercontig / SO=protein_coding / is_pseudo=false
MWKKRINVVECCWEEKEEKEEREEKEASKLAQKELCDEEKNIEGDEEEEKEEEKEEGVDEEEEEEEEVRKHEEGKVNEDNDLIIEANKVEQLKKKGIFMFLCLKDMTLRNMCLESNKIQRDCG